MVYFSLRRLFVAFFCFCVVSVSHAFAPTPGQEYTCSSVTGWFPSRDAACSAAASQWTASSSTWEYINPRLQLNGAQCVLDGRNKTTQSVFVGLSTCTIGSRAKDICPANSTLSGGQCSCDSGFKLIDGQCVPDCPEGQVLVNGVCTPPKCPKAGTSAGEFSMPGDSTVSYTCFVGCMVAVKSPMCVSFTQDGKPYSACTGDGKYTGAECTGPTGSGSSTGGNSGGSTGGTNGGTGGTSGGGTGGTSGPGSSPFPGPKPPIGTPTPTQPDPLTGDCAAGTSKASDGKCYPSSPTTPSPAGTCPAGYALVGAGSTATCNPITPGGGGTSGGSSGGTSGGSSGNGDCPEGSDKVSCATLGGTAEDGIGRVTKTLSYTPDYVLGSGSSGIPNDFTVQLHTGQVITFTNMVWFADKLQTIVRPIAILLATISAIFIVTGAAGGKPED